MDKKIRIAICGYGNLGRGVETEILKNKDMQLVCVFSRRNPEKVSVKSDVPVININEAEIWKDKIDVVIMCGGSATDLPVQGPLFAKLFNTIDSFDTHAKIPEYYKNMDESAKLGNNVSIISVGWDPGLFSLNRLYMESVVPNGNTYTFWGTGISQGHSDAIRRVEGVKDARQYTIPYEEAVNRVRRGENPNLSVRDKHFRECYVVLEEGADAKKVEEQIKTMPNYFADYNTEVHFISEEELKEKHSKMPHGGFVIRSSKTGEDTKQIMEYSLKLESNPEFTASVLLAYARAAYKMKLNGESGAKSVFDVAPALLSGKTAEELLQNLL